MTVIEEIGEGMRADEKFAPMILAPIEVVGVDQLADAVKVTLGPKGRNVALDKKYGAP